MKKWVRCGQNRIKQSYHVFYLLIAISYMHDICVFRYWLKTWKLERPNRVLKRKSGQHTASEGASHARRAAGLAETAGAGWWVSSKSVPTENPRRFHYLEQSDLQEKFSMFSNMCITAVLQYQYRHFDDRREKTKNT